MLFVCYSCHALSTVDATRLSLVAFGNMLYTQPLSPLAVFVFLCHRLVFRVLFVCVCVCIDSCTFRLTPSTRCCARSWPTLSATAEESSTGTESLSPLILSITARMLRCFYMYDDALLGLVVR